MTIQKKKILESADYIKSKNPFKGTANLALVTYYNPKFLDKFKSIKKIKFADIPSFYTRNTVDSHNELIFASINKKNLFILNGRYDYYNGCSMRDISHPIYVLNALGVKTVVLVDEAGHLNPRFRAGEVALIYDHINLMGDNPLIGENDNSIGPRFPDMSNAYDSSLYSGVENLLIDIGFRFFPSVYLGILGPETETEAECRFYRDIGSDILGYSLIPENLAAVHSGMKCLAFCMLSRELVADRLKEISEEEKRKNRISAEKKFATIISDLIKIL